MIRFQPVEVKFDTCLRFEGFIADGLLQAKLPAVLRMYRDTLTLDMKSAIKTAVAELLPVLVGRPTDSDFGQGERMVDADGMLADVHEATTDLLSVFTTIRILIFLIGSFFFS